MLQALFSSDTRIKLLKILLLDAEDSFYLRQLAVKAGVSAGNARRELKNLVDAGIVICITQGRQTYYRINARCPIIPELRSIFIKTVGLADVLKDALAELSDHIQVAFIYGSFAKGTATPDSDIDLMIVGDVSFLDVISILRPAQDQINREINPSVYPVDEFAARVQNGDHFICTVLNEPVIFLIGDEHELAGLASTRLDSCA